MTKEKPIKYIYVWMNNPKRESLYGRKCMVLKWIRKNSVIVEFENGQKECVSRNSIRRVKHGKCYL